MLTTQEKLDKLREEYAKIGTQITTLYEQLRKENTDTLDLSNITPEFFMSIRNMDQYTREAYKKLQHWFDTYSGVYWGGQHIETEQPYLRIIFDQDKQLGIMSFVPYIKCNQVGIFEHTLSQYGKYVLKNINEQPNLTITTYGREKIVKEFNTLDEALKYIYVNHPYNKKET